MNVASWTAAGATLIGATGLLGWGAAPVMAARILANPDPFPRERLVVECEGERVAITRPDGTVLHALAAGSGPPGLPRNGIDRLTPNGRPAPST